MGEQDELIPRLLTGGLAVEHIGAGHGVKGKRPKGWQADWPTDDGQPWLRDSVHSALKEMKLGKVFPNPSH